MPTLAVNKKATFEYEILSHYEAGVILTGPETKSAKAGQVQLKGSFVSVKNREVWLKSAHISHYKPAGNSKDYDPIRPRKLLLHKKEIRQLVSKMQEKGLTLIPTKMYTKNNLVKVDIALAKGKKKADKRESIKRRETNQTIRRALRNKV